MENEQRIGFTLNGERVRARVAARQHLGDLLRLEFGLTGVHLGCEHGVCGACTIRVDGRAVRACLMLAVQADGAAVETIEGLTESGEIADLQDAFHRRNALQCGYCTPGMLVTAAELLAETPRPSREAIREAVGGNYCRCTGYHAIVDAIAATAETRIAATAEARVAASVEPAEAGR
ncbi:(2Fe-2S)-binding protein [Methylobacterium isbiliense]|jgi:carbon-monoxide dehydrogenase small subunit|uniref:Caffeine dehydrogenase subunit gamma n=1 Tax=Methylobacterium isbiliense TaxID=315478 RepID=A0ABQ4SKY1_9HYPH|nr:(2Fe-2S)-binding protein [Methylobacterium isbiliense]MDN3626693.1 (2Fe-2S)-binding protein [Methylobacterium isbiliense]GJE03802.1 Caffeine dehydrogenase subunit gamma [Methylobacterium isbiliense]